MATLMETVQEIILEEIDQGITESLPELDPVFTQVVRSAVGVRRDGIGRDWKVKHTFNGSICGAVSWHSPQGETVTMDGSHDGDGFTLFGDGHTWQGIGEMPGAGIIQKVIQLVQGRTNFPVPMELMRSDLLSASTGSAVAQIIKGFAKRYNLAGIHCFWKEDTNNVIGTITPTGNITTASTGQVYTLTAGRIRSFFPGLLLDPYQSNSIIGSVDNPVAVTAVDYLAKKITIRTVTGTRAVGTTSTDFKPHNVDSQSPAGLIDWVKSSGTLFNNALSLTKYPQFRSIVDSGFSGALESENLNKVIGGFVDAYGTELDTIVTTAGTMLGFIQNMESTQQLIRYNVQGKAINVTAGFQPFGYVYDGRTFQFLTSPNCQIGNVWVLKLRGGNIRKYVPPRLPGSKSDGRFSGEIEFVAPLWGSSTIFAPLHDTNGKQTNMLQAPGYSYMEFTPQFPQAIRASTFGENVYTG